MNTLKIVLPLLAAALLADSAAAQGKIGLIDLQQVFKAYYKTKAADALIQDKKADLLKQKKGMLDQYQKAVDDHKKALDESNNQAVSADEREKRKKSAETCLLEVKRIEDLITQFERSAGAQLEEKAHHMRESILEEIRTVVNAKAKAGGFSMVFDSSAESLNNQTSILLYHNGENDLTTNILNQLNAGQPLSASSPAEKKEDKK